MSTLSHCVGAEITWCLHSQQSINMTNTAGDIILQQLIGDNFMSRNINYFQNLKNKERKKGHWVENTYLAFKLIFSGI